MKSIFYFFALVSFCSLILFGCDNEKDISSKPAIQGRLIKKTGCLGEKSDSIVLTTSDTLSCADYFYYPLSNKLLINHFNAGFNCCPDSIYCSISTSADTIIIKEFESNYPCNCNCLYNLEFEILGVESKTYIIKFIEPYRGNQEQLIFEANLEQLRYGNQCATRNEYPWGK